MTIDHWTSHRKGFVGFTAHWYNESLEMKHACVAIKRVLGRCTYDVLANLIHTVLEDYGIHNDEKVFNCVTDSGSNFIKAFTDFSTHRDDATPNQAELGDSAMSPTSLDDILSDDDILHLSSPYSLPRHFRCAAHRLSLVASKDAENALTNPTCKRVFRKLMGKLTDLFNKQNRSTVFSDKIKAELGGLFVVHNATRWNSLFDALKRVKSFYDTKPATMNSLLIDLGLSPISSDETTFLKEILEVMEPLASGLDILQGDKVSLGYLLPTLYEILESWTHLLEDENRAYTSGLLSDLSASLRRRFPNDIASEDCIVAAAVHPSFRIHWVPPEDVETVTSLVRKSLDNYSTQSMQPDIVQDATTAPSQPEPPRKKVFFSRMHSKAASTAQRATLGINDKWIAWAKKQPDDGPVPNWLEKPFIDFNTSLPTSAPVERLFSLGKRVMSPQRTLLTDENFENLTMLAFDCYV